MFTNFLKTETEQEKQFGQVIELLKDSPTLETLKSERHAKIQDQRRAVLERIAAAEQERSEILPGLWEGVQAAKLRIQELEARFKADHEAARSELDRTDYEYSRLKFQIEHAISRDRRLLMDTAAPELDEFYRWLLTEDNKARNKCTVKLGIKRNPFGGASLSYTSNSAAISRRRDGIKAAMIRVEAMWFEVVEDLAVEIANLKASIPPDAYTDESSEAPCPTVAPDEKPRYSDSTDERPKFPQPDVSWFSAPVKAGKVL